MLVLGLFGFFFSSFFGFFLVVLSRADLTCAIINRIDSTIKMCAYDCFDVYGFGSIALKSGEDKREKESVSAANCKKIIAAFFLIFFLIKWRRRDKEFARIFF